MRVLVADKFEQSGLDGLAGLGCEVSCEPGLKDQALAERVAEFKPDVLVVRSTKVGEPVLAAGPLKLVLRAGAGYNTIDLAAASRRGIYVSNCPGKNSVAVAELAFGLILALDRRIADNVISLRAGQWKKGEFSKARGLFGRTLGLLGVGSIGSQMIPRAKAFGMRVVAWSRSLSAEKAEALGIERRDSPRAVAAAADIVSVHLALGPETRRLCDAAFFAEMKKGAYFINTARGEVVDEEALKAAIRAFGLVWMSSPMSQRARRASSQARSHRRRRFTARTISARPPKRRRRPLRRRRSGLCAYSWRPASRRML